MTEQDKFEAEFEAEAKSAPGSLKTNWREGNGYRADAWFLNGAWHGWQLARKAQEKQ